MVSGSSEECEHLSHLTWNRGFIFCWFMFIQFSVMKPEEVLEPFKAGVTYDTASINPTIYLPFLQKQLKDRGVEFQRRTFSSLWEAFSLTGENGVLVNATGLGNPSSMSCSAI
jgi:hypothetical protein